MNVVFFVLYLLSVLFLAVAALAPEPFVLRARVAVFGIGLAVTPLLITAAQHLN